MTDIVERLRRCDVHDGNGALCKEAADEIERLRGPLHTPERYDEIAKLRARIAELEAELADTTECMKEVLGSHRDHIAELEGALNVMADHFGPLEDNEMLNDECRKCFAIARAALAQGDE